VTSAAEIDELPLPSRESSQSTTFPTITPKEEAGIEASLASRTVAVARSTPHADVALSTRALGR
jgi:hypothetical protein